MIQEQRVQYLNNKKIRGGRYVLYWMQQSQRAHFNHALEYAVTRADELKVPVVVLFCLTDNFPEARERHYRFMLEGLVEVQAALKSRGMAFIVLGRDPVKNAVMMAEESSLAVTDRGYLRIQKRWRKEVSDKIRVPFVQVESDVIVPVESASDKEEYSAATIRRKINRLLPSFMVPVAESNPEKESLTMEFNLDNTIELRNPDDIIAGLSISHNVENHPPVRGGSAQAGMLLDHFITKKLPYYDTLANDPSRDFLSRMSPYLHFGQISPLYIALKVSRTNHSSRSAYLEELIVRRELAMNFVLYNDRYDSFLCLPEWARKTLRNHAGDRREYCYSPEQLEHGKTHDPYWNAAQKEMVLTGTMHGYMRMYWGKKIIEWSPSPEEAYTRAVYLNNKYELDGRDPNGFAGIAWCFGKHDRPWSERPIFGKVRYMNAAGLKKKFDIEKYVNRIMEYETGIGKTPCI